MNDQPEQVENEKVRPKTYGEVMRQLLISRLPTELQEIYSAEPTFKEWVLLTEKVMRAEKISHWSEWTQAEREAYDRGDVVEFSRLRGYSESEIADFRSLIELTKWIELSENDDELGITATHEIRKAVSTPELEKIDADLMQFSLKSSQATIKE